MCNSHAIGSRRRRMDVRAADGKLRAEQFIRGGWMNGGFSGGNETRAADPSASNQRIINKYACCSHRIVSHRIASCRNALYATVFFLSIFLQRAVQCAFWAIVRFWDSLQHRSAWSVAESPLSDCRRADRRTQHRTRTSMRKFGSPKNRAYYTGNS